MADGFHHLSMRPSDLADDAAEIGFRAAAIDGAAIPSNEAVARHYLDLAMRASSAQPAFRGIVAAERPERVPALELAEELRSPFGENTVVRFTQTHRRIPVYGARVTVELEPGQTLSHIDVDVADGEELDAVASPIPRMSPHEAMQSLGSQLGAGDLTAELGTIAALSPQLRYFRDRESERFVLCWFFARVPIAPPSRNPANGDRATPVGGWEAAVYRQPVFDYLIDATTGRLVAALSVSRTFDVPIECTGNDEDEVERTFDGMASVGGFEMFDPVRSVATHDFQFGVYGSGNPPLNPPVTNTTPAWGATNRAAVTAHVQAIIVHDFFESVLHRQGVDGKKMVLTSVVNCAANAGGAEWFNAQWTGARMIYGQNMVGGRLVSLGRYLDVVAHELTHGITQHTANLDYEFESGALSESMSDIFGIIVANVAAGRPDPREIEWSWELGTGLGAAGGPLRNFMDPKLGTPAQPSEMSGWVTKTLDDDAGGVHYNSGIHNRAAYLVLTAELADGSLAIEPEEVARLYYFVLLELTSNAGFSDARGKFVELIRTRKQADPRCAERVAAVEAAYDAVGII